MRMGIGLGVGINRSNYAQGIFNAYSARVVADGGVVESGSCVDAVSEILLNASLLLIPSGYKGGKLYAEIPTNGNGDLTWTRTSTAIRTNSSGLLESMATGVPRLSYMYGSCPAVLLEPQRTNLALYSEQFNDATWVKSQSSITANSTTSPDGNTTADTFTGDGNLAQHFVYQNNSLTSGVVYTMSVYAKKNTNDFLQITAGSFLFGVNAFANFNLNNGTIGTVGSSATATITSIANGWYRCTMTATATTTGSGLSALYTLISSSTSARAEINSLATSLYLWGAQLELGAYATTIIPTTSATATRVADTFSRNNIYTNGLISASGGTWFVELRNNVAYLRDSSSGFGIGDSSSLGTNSIFLRLDQLTSARLAIIKRLAGIPYPLYTTTTDTTKIAIKWNGTSADIFENGTKVVSATSFTATNMDFLAVGSALGVGVPIFIQQMALFNSPLTDAQCQTLTT